MLTQAGQQRLKDEQQRRRHMSHPIISAILFVFLSLPPSFTVCQTGCFEEEDAGVTLGSRKNDKDQPFPLRARVCVQQPCR